MVSGTITIKVYNSMGIINSEKSIMVKLPSWLRTDIPVGIKLPAQPGGYLLVAKFTPENGSPVLSRRFLKVGEMATYSYFSMDPKVK
jgi:hypothetical protein